MVNSFIISHIETKNDFENYLKFIEAIWPGENVDAMANRISKNLPYFTFNNILIIKKMDRIVASLMLIPQTWCYGDVPIKVAEMGLVATLPEFRNIGLQRILNKEYDKVLMNENYDFSVIEGIPYFYRQFGYEYTIPLDSVIDISLKLLPNKKNIYFIRRLKFLEIPQIIRLNEISRKKFFLYSNRSSEIWEKQEQNGWQADWPFETFVVTENEYIEAYFRIGVIKDKVVLIEISDTNEAMSEAISGFIKDLGFNKGANELVSRINHNEFFSKYLVSKGGKMNSPYAWQVKVVNYANFFNKIIPKLNDRLSSSSFSLINDELKLNFFKTSVILKIKNGQISEIEERKGEKRSDLQFNPIVFTKILLGVKSSQELQLNYPDISINPNYQDLIDTLFPKFASNIYPCY